MEPRTASDLAPSLEDERIRPFLPLVYLAWSDGELTRDEIEGVCAEVARHAGIDLDCQVALRHWLDPDRPPSPVELELLRSRVAAWAATVDLPDSASVADLGIAIAESTRPDASVSQDERAALADIESRYGPLGPTPPALGASIRLRDIVAPEGSFEPAQLTTVLDGQWAHARRQMREVLARPEFIYKNDLSKSDYRELVLRWTQILADEGFGSLGYPAPYGADDLGAFVAAFATLGHHDLSLLTKFGVQFGLFGGSVSRLGTDRHHAEYLSDIGSLALPGCFAMTETGHGSNVRDLETTATYDANSDELVISTPCDLARKDYIGNAASHGRLAVVFARLLVDATDHGVHAVLVPIRDTDGSVLPGIRIEDNESKGGLNGVDNGRIWFDSVRVPRSALLDRFGSIGEDGVYTSDIPNPDRRFFTMIGTLVGGRVSVGAASVNVAKSALTIALRYAHRRRQFGPAPEAEALLIEYPLHQHRMIPRLAATYAYHFAFEELIGEFASGSGDQRDLEATAAGLKAFATWQALDTIQAAREACGGQGFLTENRLTSMRSDADIFTTYEGDNTVLTQLVAKGLLSEFRQQFESMSATGMVRYVFHRAAAVVAESSPLTVSPTDEGHLLDATWQIEQLHWRRMHQVESLAKRMKKRFDSGSQPFDAFTEVQTHAMRAAASHVDWIVLKAFASAATNVESDQVRAILDRLRALHGLAVIGADLAWYQEHGHLSAASARAIRKLHDRLVREIAPESLALVEAFAIPDQVLAAPIAAKG
ncbi:MAG: acyl-CoA dehydrogenase [Acidimicrobiia bacterium]|nr:MAG: acyl-CoA dehydrogenase [Acidimicrobiia bacterium]